MYTCVKALNSILSIDKKKSGVLAMPVILAGGWQLFQLGQFSDLGRLCLKIKKKKSKACRSVLRSWVQS